VSRHPCPVPYTFHSWIGLAALGDKVVRNRIEFFVSGCDFVLEADACTFVVCRDDPQNKCVKKTGAPRSDICSVISAE
jgi:hypothetical protein